MEDGSKFKNEGDADVEGRKS